ncbi:MAG: 4-hydroxy-tetrahydrodipicolinate reductase [Proteobacteria bacterium]|nr:4-hydroxy-tetrahydrodipicolinate reductase [Pseudomonadota bacterium]
MIKAVVTGAAGRMGGRIISIIGDTEGIELSGALEHSGHDALGKDVGELAGIGEVGVKITSALDVLMADADVMIDFTFPEVTLKNLEIVKKHNKAAVIGSTGFTADEVSMVKNFANEIPCILAPNMSMGVNVMLKLVAEAARALGDDFDIEMVETHHRMKKDAPSGTAMKLAEVAAESVGRKLSEVGVFERFGIIGPRTDKEIGVQTLRGGDVVGDHTVYFYGTGERLEITHRATSRDTFASGAVKGALWLAGKEPSLYDMHDVLGLKG